MDTIVIVDNNSGSEELSILKEGIVRAGLSELTKIKEAHENKGFSAGNNIGIQTVDAEYYLLTNSDTIIQKGTISELLSAADKYPGAGLFGPRLVSENGEVQISCFKKMSPLYELISAAGVGPVSRFLKKYSVVFEEHCGEDTPAWISFACVLIRKNVVETSGLMDEEYFMYYEDVDYCRRAKDAGFDIIYVPEAEVVHLVGQSSKLKKLETEKKRLPEYFYRARSRYYIKYYGYNGFIRANIFWYLGRFLSLFRRLINGKKRLVPSGQHLDIWKK
jgi:hypothetical protein